MNRSIYILILALSACDVDDDCTRAAQFPAEIYLGVGEKTFSALEDGDDLDLDYGNQGGSHAWVALQTTGIAPGANPVIGEGSAGPIVDLYLSYDGVELGHGSSHLRPFKGDEALAEATGLQLGMGWFEESESSTVDWRAVTLTAELEDQCGTTLIAEALVSVNR
ncbi:MAG: hypothetical protein GWP91_18575 [Rhodobacterales bacterium]|nr:hypothetical protein [Rhodobacterales bacterium]